MKCERLIQMIQSKVPQLLALYAFGSRIGGTAAAHSDLDLAVLVAGYAEPLTLFELAGELAEVAGSEVDLLDLRAASTVMQYQIITSGERWWAQDSQAALFEAAILSEKTALDTARAGLLADIQQRGRVYGR
ncbi:MAG: nucleotidyltransferase domain-containing protein [Corallincola sp.]|nr:nucleotidyltransferase domain-containing protein [Corallincola sp.]